MAKAWKNPVRPISLSELALHNKRRSCWIAVDGKVYDVTRYISRHPGGDIILKGAGGDASSLFHVASKYGHVHPIDAETILQKYYIGELANVSS